ncbi:MAG: NB-ARC domain-containing protein, partial [Anaerolineae bacterium]|nr:NB-ARC domain-containing protein [Anaerolineae bacterium]
LYRGNFMGGFFANDAREFEHWQLREEEYWHAQFIQTSQLHIQQLRAAGQLDAAIAAARHALTYAPLWEDFHRALIQLYHATGERAAALHQYQTCKNLLWEELGVEPDASTQALLEHLKRGAPAVHLPAPRRNLPPRMGGFVGRGEVLRSVSGLVERHALLTLCATGGAGKTRLALEVAHQMGNRFAGGVCYVDLTSTQRPEDVAPAIAQALSIHDLNETPLHEAVAARGALLLVLDNFEHVIEAAGIIPPLIDHAPDLRVLVTSREPLKLYGEQLFRLGALTLEEACLLFRERVRAVNPDFRRSEEADRLVEAICDQLEGLPLAIELAATRARTQSLDEIRQGLACKLDLLTSDLRNLPRRQRAMYYTIEWSYQLLTPEQADVFRTLAAFRGGWTRHALAQLSPHAALLDDLVDKSLVRRAAAGTPRYNLYETVREYAVHQLERAENAHPVRIAHAHWVMGFVESFNQRLKTRDHAQALTDIRDEEENIYAALDFAANQPDLLEVYARTLSAIGWIWYIRPPYRSPLAHFQHAVSQTDALSVPLRADLLAAAGHIADVWGLHESAEAWQRAALVDYTALGDEHSAAYVRFYLTGRTTMMDDIRDQLTSLRTYALGQGDDYLLSMVDLNLGWTLFHRGEAPAAERYLREGLSVAEQNGYQIMLSTYYMNLGMVCAANHVLDEAVGLLERARANSQADGNIFMEALVTLDQCHLLYMSGQPSAALDYLNQAQPLVERSSAPMLVVTYHFWRGVMAADAGQWEAVRHHDTQALKRLNPYNGNMSNVTFDLIIHITLLLARQGHWQSAALLLGWITHYGQMMQYAYSRHHLGWLAEIEVALSGHDAAGRSQAAEQGAQLTTEAMLSAARDALLLLG